MTLRKTLFWLHLIAGAVAGIVILIMSVTGVLLMYEKQIIAWADQRGLQATPPAPGAARLSMEAMLAKVRETRQATPAAISVTSDLTAPVSFSFGRESTAFVDPYSGAIVGEGSKGVREFFHVVTDWHRWLGMEGTGRATGRAITGASNLAFLVLVVSGIYLWWPRTWNRSSLRAVTWFRGGLPGKARDFNWHNVIGFWSCVPLFLVVVSGAVISYPWASNLVYKLAGSEPPALRGKGGPAGKGGPPGGGERGQPGRRPPGGPGGFPAPPRDFNAEGLDRMWARAEQQVSGWKTITLRLPPSNRAPLTFLIDRGSAGQPQKRGTLVLDRQTGDVREWETFAGYDRGRQLRSWLRFVHTGEYYGMVGQTIAGIASLGGAFLVYTGIALALRRFVAWRSRRARRQSTAALAEREAIPR